MRLALGLPLTALIGLSLNGCVVSLVQPEDARTEYVEAHQDLDDDVAKAIRLGKVIPGMTREQVEACWGSPSEVDKSEAIGLNLEWGKEVWSYSSDSVFIVDPEATVYFNNGKVTEVSPAYLSDLE